MSRKLHFGWTTLALLALGFLLVATAYWPGIMIDDARWQYQQSVDNAYEDWHPPLMAWVWRGFMLVHPGPGPMLLLQLALLWLGLGLVAYWAYRRQQPRLAIGIALVGWIPATLALSGSVTKDCLMAGTLCCATGLVLLRAMVVGRARRTLCSLGAVGLIIFAAALRLNALVACVPLLLVALPKPFVSSKLKVAGSALVGTLALLAVGPLINTALAAEKTDVSLSLIIFDLGGITEHSQANQFPDVGVRDPVAVNHRCYDPVEWDSYADWAPKPCPLGFDAVQSAKDENDLDMTAIWIGAVLHHPLAYAQHRLTHFNLSTDFLVHSGPIFTAWKQSVDNPWGFHVRPNAAIDAVTATADAAARTPLGWPIFWIAVALASVLAGVLAEAPIELTALAASGFLYGTTYLVAGVAVGMRYYFWTITGAALAAVLIVGELVRRGSRPSSVLIFVPLVIVAIPTALAVVARMTL
jgi:hypothetical protein